MMSHSPPNQKQQLNDARDVRALLEIEEGLSEWEVLFAESLAEQVIDDKRRLSRQQRDILNTILARVG